MVQATPDARPSSKVNRARTAALPRRRARAEPRQLGQFARSWEISVRTRLRGGGRRLSRTRLSSKIPW